MHALPKGVAKGAPSVRVCVGWRPSIWESVMYDSRLIDRESYGNASSEILAGAVLSVIICNELRSHETSPRGPARPGPHMYQPARPRGEFKKLEQSSSKVHISPTFHFVI